MSEVDESEDDVSMTDVGMTDAPDLVETIETDQTELSYMGLIYGLVPEFVVDMHHLIPHPKTYRAILVLLGTPSLYHPIQYHQRVMMANSRPRGWLPCRMPKQASESSPRNSFWPNVRQYLKSSFPNWASPTPCARCARSPCTSHTCPFTSTNGVAMPSTPPFLFRRQRPFPDNKEHYDYVVLEATAYLYLRGFESRDDYVARTTVRSGARTVGGSRGGERGKRNKNRNSDDLRSLKQL
ncbi:hypothetical protein N656DRAFT_404823 [Canariomyces notabilis]|uniref:Uncharacterized protein n=1 Tax=Canariomyces notabilis TaxID=2074819 RepID=A0AAN6TJY6_9PEZI|nr:hypothetical protein N656DRAFT_404823 [Canariomyces arenarius]